MSSRAIRVCGRAGMPPGLVQLIGSSIAALVCVSYWRTASDSGGPGEVTSLRSSGAADGALLAADVPAGATEHVKASQLEAVSLHELVRGAIH